MSCLSVCDTIVSEGRYIAILVDMVSPYFNRFTINLVNLANALSHFYRSISFISVRDSNTMKCLEWPFHSSSDGSGTHPDKNDRIGS